MQLFSVKGKNKERGRETLPTLIDPQPGIIIHLHEDRNHTRHINLSVRASLFSHQFMCLRLVVTLYPVFQSMTLCASKLVSFLFFHFWVLVYFLGRVQFLFTYLGLCFSSSSFLGLSLLSGRLEPVSLIAQLDHFYLILDIGLSFFHFIVEEGFFTVLLGFSVNSLYFIDG